MKKIDFETTKKLFELGFTIRTCEIMGFYIIDNDAVYHYSNIGQTLTEYLKENGIDKDKINDIIATSTMKKSEEIFNTCVTYKNEKYSKLDRTLDKILTGKLIGYPVMILLLMIVFWITIVGANYPSELLGKLLFWLQDKLTELFVFSTEKNEYV